jgi:hypothetical protein
MDGLEVVGDVFSLLLLGIRKEFRKPLEVLYLEGFLPKHLF